MKIFGRKKKPIVTPKIPDTNNPKGDVEVLDGYQIRIGNPLTNNWTDPINVTFYDNGEYISKIGSHIVTLNRGIDIIMLQFRTPKTAYWTDCILQRSCFLSAGDSVKINELNIDKDILQ